MKIIHRPSQDVTKTRAFSLLQATYRESVWVVITSHRVMAQRNRVLGIRGPKDDSVRGTIARLVKEHRWIGR